MRVRSTVPTFLCGYALPSVMVEDISKVVDVECQIGECPVWDDQESVLYWTDIPMGRLYAYDPASGRHHQVHERRTLGGFTLQADGSKLLFGEERSVERLRDGETEPIIDPDPAGPRFNDVVADPAGGVFCGTMPEAGEDGRLYRLSPDGDLTLVLEAVGVPNGLGFSPDGTQLYFTESTARRISRFDFDPNTGTVTNRETLVEFRDERTYNGMPANLFPVPDGLTVDGDGCIWSVLFGGEGLVRIAPDGTEMRRIELPVKTSTSLAFGGDSYSELYVTTGRIGDRDLGEDDPGAGAVFSTRFDDLSGRAPLRSDVSP